MLGIIENFEIYGYGYYIEIEVEVGGAENKG